MFRNRVRPPTPPLDEVIAERLLRGDPIDDLPDAFRPLGRLLGHATAPATAGELEGSAAAAAAFVAGHHASTARRRRTWSMAASVLTALTVAASTGTAVAATQGALPEPIQQVAHEALGVVGISVPSIEQRSDDNGRANDSVSTPASNAGVGGSRVVTSTTAPSPLTGTPAAVPATTETDPQTSEHADGNGNAYAGEGNSGNGNAYAGEGNAGNGNAYAGGGNSGNGGVPPTTVPDTNLPPQSNGNGNGPPQVPPGQGKK